jgi:cellulose synthase/poly-beta-1,6-N-acetylglucosamine synthase-like glycosyltransferase
MFQLVPESLNFLAAATWRNLFALFVLVVVYDIPRYYLGFIAVALLSIFKSKKPMANGGGDFVSVVIPGHNEEEAVERCVLSLWEQSRPPDEIVVVSDGSTDRMPDKLRDLQERGLIQEAHCTQLRGGKAAALNLGIGRTKGNIIVVIDCDCTLDRHALKNIIEPFSDPGTGAVVGNIMVRNAKASLIATCQAIEYLICISLGKRAADVIDGINCISGAFGAFRRETMERLGGYDAGGSEDLEITFRVREADLKIRFASNAIIYTDVPTTVPVFIRQRFSWDQYTLNYRNRKHGYLLNPLSPRFNFIELLHTLDFLLFSVGGGIGFWFYLVWVLSAYGDFAPVVLIGIQLWILALESCAFLLAGIMTPEVRVSSLLPYMPAYSFFYQPFMRSVRSVAYIREWVFHSSYTDRVAPRKVHSARPYL